ncbi:MAG TPA: TonB-dependent receptor [Candidatus Elarobacter sp.]|nr:TonB-dependent receptor [Candidatus Elarobacter sp.]
MGLLLSAIDVNAAGEIPAAYADGSASPAPAIPQPAASPPSPAIAGTVYDGFGHALAGAVVTLTGQPSRSVTTGPDGAFRFDDVDSSAHGLLITHAGYTDARQASVATSEGAFVVRLFAASAGNVAPAPRPSSEPDLKTIGRVQSRGRIDNLIGTASSAAEGFVGHTELEERPILRPGELLETVPGVVISQHSGEGKANQYYLRGFNLDHGTDIAITIGGIPANMRTHAHGQGYSDVNWLIPETVNYVNYRKGTYNADQGDFSTAGAVNMTYFNVLPKSIATVSGGPYGQARVLLAASPAAGPNGHFLYALEYAHEDNTADHPDNYRKYDALLRYSRQVGTTLWGVTAQGYEAKWMSSDQIPLRAVQQGIIDRFGAIDPTDAGRTHRYVLSTDFSHDTAKSSTQINAYAMDYSLHLFSDFTYSLNDPENMDQFEQTDQRLVTGVNASQTWKTPVADNTIGYQMRNDNITPVGLYLTRGRAQIGVTRVDRVVETSNAVYVQTSQHLTPKLRMTAGVRADVYNFSVRDLRPENSGSVRAGIVSPKIAFSYTVNPKVELYADYGQGFHSNDARGITETVDPGTGLTTDPGTGQILQGATPLVRAQGAELGVRFAVAQKLRTTVSLWNLNLASELIFQGDAGTTSPGRPSHRYGFELANFYVPSPGVTLDFDYSSSAAKFTNFDPVGQTIPGSIKDVLTFGIAVDKPHAFGSIRLRYFGPRPLIEDASVHSNPTTTVSLQAGLKPSRGLKVGFDVFNLLGAKASDIDYYYNSSLPSDPAYTKPGFTGTCPIDQCGVGVPDVHFHPIERRLIRLTVTKQF